MSGEIGARLGLEFLPWTNIADLWSGVRFIEAAGHPNGGLVIDVWHMDRSGSLADDLLKVQVDYVSGVELNDADSVVVGGLYEDTIDRRRYCGEGTFELPAFISALRRIGWTGPWGVEILSTQHRRTRVELALEKAYETARQQLELGRAG
jgi:sugar phosphate isomerase/epimerase